APSPFASPAKQSSLHMGFRPTSETPVPTEQPNPVSAPQASSTELTHPPASTRPTVHSALPPEPVPLLKVPLRLVGVIGRLYVLLESDRGLVLLDQHAAHERILFEQMLNRLEKNQQAPSQRLLLPETVELSARDAIF